MRMETSLSQRQELQLRLAPQILQSIEILQLATLDLKGLIEREMEANPTLEIQSEEPLREVASTEQEALPDDVPTKESLEAEFERLEGLNEQWKEFSGTYRPRAAAGEKDKKLEAMQNTADRSESLQEVLQRQLAELNLKERDVKIATYLIWNIDENGYVRYRIDEEFVKGVDVDPPCTVEEMLDVLELVQDFEPPGVGARDLKECLLLQLEKGNVDHRYDLEIAIVRDYLDDVVANRLPKIAKELGEPIETIDEAINFIRSLNPKPGRVFSNEQVHYVIPDVVVEQVDGKWEVRVEDAYIPRIHISKHYQEMLHTAADDPKVRAYVQKKITAAKQLMKSIEQRKSTLWRIAQEIVDYQKPFLEKGIDALRPLKMQYIADRVGVHVSTVSRAIANKYIQTPRGIFALKFFFTGGTTRADGEQKSIVAVKQKVRDIVEKEDKSHPLSDEEIAAALKKQGLDIARRTVTKYRKQLGIPSSRQRRKFV
ncbi:MAG: RNA polymerase sigma-54 factor [Planctomycetota bacterium]|nr:MAG: RNA polymerase sigma-54 factor [Planctomycetota bacterium]